MTIELPSWTKIWGQISLSRNHKNPWGSEIERASKWQTEVTFKRWNEVSEEYFSHSSLWFKDCSHYQYQFLLLEFESQQHSLPNLVLQILTFLFLHEFYTLLTMLSCLSFCLACASLEENNTSFGITDWEPHKALIKSHYTSVFSSGKWDHKTDLLHWSCWEE